MADFRLFKKLWREAEQTEAEAHQKMLELARNIGDCVRTQAWEAGIDGDTSVSFDCEGRYSIHVHLSLESESLGLSENFRLAYAGDGFYSFDLWSNEAVKPTFRTAEEGADCLVNDLLNRFSARIAAYRHFW